MEDKGLDFTKPPPEPEYPPVNRSVPRCFLLREAGFKFKTNTAPIELQWAAEDEMVMRPHEDFRCHLPDVSRSTFLMVFSPDGTKVASTHGNHNVYVTDLTTGKNIKTLTGHPRTPWCIAFHPSSNQILASGCLGGQVRVWDLSGGSEIWMAESQTVIASLAFHPVDRMLVIASYNELHFWDWSQPEPFAKCFTSNEKEKVRYVAFDALGHKLITGVSNAPARPASQWDRVAAPQPPPQTNQLDSERRITICYRYMVEQYEQLVQRYCDLSRARSTLTMDRGTDPMEFEGETSDNQSTLSPNVTRAARPRGSESPRRVSFAGPSTRPHPSSGTDEASASHSSTNFLTPPEPSQIEDCSPPVTQPLIATSNEPSPNNNTNESVNRPDTPRRNPRFDITLPSFSSFRTRSSILPDSIEVQLPPCISTRDSQSSESTRTRPLSRLSLSPETIGFGLTGSHSSASQDTLNETTHSPTESSTRPVERSAESSTRPVERSAESSTRPVERSAESSTRPVERSAAVQQLVRNLVSSWCTRNNPSGRSSTEVNSTVDSDNEEEDDIPRMPEVHSEEERQPVSGISYTQLGSQRSYNPLSRSLRNSESSARRFSEASAVSQLRTQFHRLQSVYENRNSAYTSHAHVFSPETQAAERRLLNRLNEILERPLPEPRARRLFASRRSAFQPRPQPPPTTPSTSTGSVTAASPDIIGDVRYGIQLLSRHIDNMQRLCRARLEILQLQQIRRMWEDLQSQIYALHGAVREGRTEERGRSQPARPDQPAETPTAAADLLTDDDSDGPSSTGELHWRLRRTPQTSRRNLFKSALPRTTNRNPPMKRTRLIVKQNDQNRRMSMFQMEFNRRLLNRQASSSTQATSEERGEASSSHVSGGETSTGTSDERGSVRGVKRKSRDSDPLFRPRPSSSNQGQTSGSGPSTSSLAAVMRETIVQLENMVWRHRQSASPRNSRLSRFTRQREERMMRNLWDTESSHESSRDDQSEGDSSQQSESVPGGTETGETEWTRDSTRVRARQVLLLMVDSLTQFFENDNLTRRTSNEALNDRIHNLYVLLQLALNLTDLLLAQLVHSRREFEARRHSMLEGGSWCPSRHAPRSSRHTRNTAARNMGRTSLAWRRILRRASPATSPSTSPPLTPEHPRRSPPAAAAAAAAVISPTPSRGLPTPRNHSVYSNIRSAMLSHYHNHNRPPIVPIVRVNDLPAPSPESGPVPRFRPHSPPPMGPHPMFVPPRFLHPARYTGGGFVFDESTSEDSSPQDRTSDFFFMRAGYGSSSMILTDTPMSPHHRIQAWDFSKYKLPDLGNAEKNVVVSECKIHNDASVDMSKDGRLLVTLLPSGRLSMTTLLGIYSLQWDTLGQLLYTTSFEQSIVSVSLSPTTRHLVVGLASRRVALISAERHTNAQVFRLEGALPGRKAPLGARGRLVHLRDLELCRHLGFMSLNCIRWAPNPGQGLVYGTNTGYLKILR